MVRWGFVVVCTIAIGAGLAAQSARPAHPQVTVTRSPQMRVLCGTTILFADPRIDRQMVTPTPPGNFTLRTMRPTMCRETLAPRIDELKQRLPYFFGPKR